MWYSYRIANIVVDRVSLLYQWLELILTRAGKTLLGLNGGKRSLL